MLPALGARPRTWLASPVRLLLRGLLVVAICSPAGADPSTVVPFLKPLDLVGYRSGMLPPPFSGHTLDGRQLSLTELRGKVVVVNFWASWCLPCRTEMPVLEGLHRELVSRGLAIIGVNAREDKRTIGRYAEELGLTFPLVLDPGGKINALYGVFGLPATFIVGRDGHAVAFGVGPREWASAPARALLEALLAEPPPRLGAR